MSDANQPVARSRAVLLDAIGDAADVTFLRGFGNIGDELIWAGARQLLRGVHYREASVELLDEVGGELGLLTGSGAWCSTYPRMAELLPAVEQRFDRVIVLPSTYEVAVPAVRSALEQTGATVFARELVSYEAIKGRCDARLAHDTAFYFDFEPYRRPGRGTLRAFRIDQEAEDRDPPPGNDDVSATCDSLDHWLWRIAGHERVLTDRAHTMIAAALLGKAVRYRSSVYYKVPALAAFMPEGVDLDTLDDAEWAALFDEPGTTAAPAAAAGGSDRGRGVIWTAQVRDAERVIAAMVPPGGSLVLVDDLHTGLGHRVGGRASSRPLEREGVYYGPPGSADQAIEGLNAAVGEGGAMLAFAWPSFWWLETWPAVEAWLDARYRRVFRDDRLRVWDLRG